MKNKISILTLALVMFFVGTDITSAYSVKETTATSLTPTTAVYTLTYKFGSAIKDFHMPIKTSRGASDNELLTLDYNVLEDREHLTQAGETAAIVLSDAEIVDNTYYVPKGKIASFTLVVFLRTEETTPEADYAIKVDKLPFTEEFPDNVIKNGLTKPELGKYLTDEVELNE